MAKHFKNLVYGLWIAVLMGFAFSILKGAWNYVDEFLGIFSVPKWIVLLSMLPVLVVLGMVARSEALSVLSSKIQTWIAGLMVRRFKVSDKEPLEPNSWTTKEVEVAIGDGCFYNNNIPAIRKHGVVTATLIERGIRSVNVQFAYPPTGTGEVMTIRQDSCKIRLTGGSAADHAKRISSFGRIRAKEEDAPSVGNDSGAKCHCSSNEACASRQNSVSAETFTWPDFKPLVDKLF